MATLVRNRKLSVVMCGVCVYSGIIGHGVSQFRWRMLKCSFPIFTRFRNPVDRQVTQFATIAGNREV